MRSLSAPITTSATASGHNTGLAAELDAAGIDLTALADELAGALREVSRQAVASSVVIWLQPGDVQVIAKRELVEALRLAGSRLARVLRHTTVADGSAILYLDGEGTTAIRSGPVAALLAMLERHGVRVSALPLTSAPPKLADASQRLLSAGKAHR